MATATIGSTTIRGRPQSADQRGAGSHPHQHAAVVHQRSHQSLGLGDDGRVLCGAEVFGAQQQDHCGQGERDVQQEDRPLVGGRHQHQHRQERADEVARAEQPAEHAQRPGPVAQRHRRGDERVPGERENRRRQADEEHARAQHPRARREVAAEQAENRHDRGADHRRPLAEAVHERTAGHVADELPYHDHGADQAHRPQASALFRGDERDHRDDGTLAGREQQGRSERRERNFPQLERALTHRPPISE
nr:hypothetical protein [Saccharopolyspora spinosa]